MHSKAWKSTTGTSPKAETGSHGDARPTCELSTPTIRSWAKQFRVGLEEDRLCTLVLLGARADGTKELAVAAGYCESKLGVHPWVASRSWPRNAEPSAHSATRVMLRSTPATRCGRSPGKP